MIALLPFISELSIVTKERGVVRFGDVMDPVQIDFIQEAERQLNTSGQIRIIVLKARQIGISTVIEAILFTLSILYQHFQSLIVSHEKDSASHILNITRTYWNTYPFRRYHDEKYNGRTHLAWGDIHSDIQVVTAKNVTAGRSRTIHALHASEAAFYDDPETLMTGLRSSIPAQGLTAIFVESTANGIGNYFHTEWLRAKRHETEFSHKFYPWHTHPRYTSEFLPTEQSAKYLAQVEAGLDKEEQILRSRGIPMERLVWRRYTIANYCQGDVEKFHQEYPTDDFEAFLTTGRNVFPLPNLVAHYAPRRGRVGRLVQVNDRIQFVDAIGGPLTLYATPSTNQDWGVYLIGADPTHTLGGDYAVAQVINRRTLEQVAVYRVKIDAVSFGPELYMLGRFFNDALIAPEKEGPGYGTVGALLGLLYPRVWKHTKIDTTPGKLTGDTFGWGTNKQTKHLAMSHLTRAVMQPLQNLAGATYGLLIHDEVTFEEMVNYVTTEDGQGYHNANGSENDDTVMALAIALTVHNIEVHPAPLDPADPSDPSTIPTRTPITSHIHATFTDPSAHTSSPLPDTSDLIPIPTPAPWEDWPE